MNLRSIGRQLWILNVFPVQILLERDAVLADACVAGRHWDGGDARERERDAGDAEAGASDPPGAPGALWCPDFWRPLLYCPRLRDDGREDGFCLPPSMMCLVHCQSASLASCPEERSDVGHRIWNDCAIFFLLFRTSKEDHPWPRRAMLICCREHSACSSSRHCGWVSCHGWGITERLEQGSRGVFSARTGSSARYPALYRLERRGLVTSRLEDDRGQPPRGYYGLTAGGRTARLRPNRRSGSANPRP